MHYISLGYFFVFIEKQYMKTPINVSIKVQKIIRTLSKMSMFNDPVHRIFLYIVLLYRVLKLPVLCYIDGVPGSSSYV